MHGLPLVFTSKRSLESACVRLLLMRQIGEREMESDDPNCLLLYDK